MHLDAKAKQSTYSIRHWIVAPHEATNRSQMLQVLEMIGQEFEFDPKRAVVVEHTKKRSTIEATQTHWHILVSEVDPVRGKILKCSFDRVIHELVARWSEFEFGHRFVLGKHTKSVINGLRKRGAVEAAQKLETEFAGTAPPAGEAFTHSQHQEKKRAGVDLPARRQIVKAAVAAATTRVDLERLLEAKSMIVAQGQKDGTWIVTNVEGILIGSLSRLAGKRKSEINDLMRRNEIEPTDDQDDHRAGNLERDASNPDVIGSHRQPRDGKPRDIDPDAKQNSGLPRPGSDPDRFPQPTTGRASSPYLNTSWWLRGLNEFQGSIYELLGRANVLALKPAERVAAALWHLEEEARFDFHRTVPNFKYSERVHKLRADVRDLETNLVRTRGQQLDADLRLRKAPRTRWWHYFLGIVFVVERRFQQLNNAVHEANRAALACERELQASNSKLLREEIGEKDRHAKQVEEIVERKRTSATTLEVVEAAYGILRMQPELAFGGTDFVLSRARAVAKEAKEIALKADVMGFDPISSAPAI